MVAAYYGERQSISQLRERSGTDRQGTNLAGLIQAAEDIGLEARGIRTDIDGLSEVGLPAVAHWSEDGRSHFVVLYRRSRRSTTIGDPAFGRRKLPIDEFQKHWTGVLVLLKPTPDLKGLSETSYTKLWSLLRHHRKIFLDALLAAVLMTVLGLSSSFFIQALVDFVFIIGREPTLNWLGLGMLLVLLARVAFLGLRAYLLAHLSQRIDADVVLGYHHHLLGLPLAFFETRRTGEILSRLNDAAKIRSAVSGTGLSVIVDSTMLALTAVVMFWMHWKLALLSLSLMPAMAASVWGLTGPMKRAQRTAMERAAGFESHLVEAIGAMPTVKAFCAEDRLRVRGEARLMETIDAGFRASMFALHSSTTAALLAGASSLGLLWFGGHEVLAGRLTVGQLMALYTMLGTALGPVERLANANQSIQDAMVAAERLGEMFQAEGEKTRERASTVERRLDGSIEFRNVGFRYGNRPAVFDDICLRIEPGECIGIAGGSGSGKTTLVRLLGRFMEPSSGRVLIDGIDVRDYDLENLRRQVVFVSQDADLFGISIAGNVSLGRPSADAQEVRTAARLAHVDEIVNRLPLGYDTVIGERGMTLSGGERQRIALARAILLDPPVLVLDEPTNHLDRTSTAAVRSLIERRSGRHTTIVISHDPLPVDRTFHIAEHAYAVGA